MAQRESSSPDHPSSPNNREPLTQSARAVQSRAGASLLAQTKFMMSGHTAIGLPAQQVHAAVSEHQCDLVCVRTRGRGTVRNLVLSSTGGEGIAHGRVPVLVVPRPTR